MAGKYTFQSWSLASWTYASACWAGTGMAIVIPPISRFYTLIGPSTTLYVLPGPSTFSYTLIA